MGAERAVDVMALAVDVAGDRAADGDEARAGRHGHEPTLRDDHPQQLVEADAGVDRDRARVGVEPDRIVARLEADHRAAAVLRRVAVRTPEAASDGAAGTDL